MEVDDDIVLNAIIDWRKKDIPMWVKGRTIKAYMKEHNISLRCAVEYLKMPKTTVHDLLSWADIDEEDYNKLVNLGYTKTQINRMVRRKEYKERLIDKNIKPVLNSSLNTYLKSVIKVVRDYKYHRDEWDSESSILCHDLKEEINKLEKSMNGSQ